MRDNSRRGPRKTWLRAFRLMSVEAGGIYSAATEEFRHPVFGSLGRQERDLSHQPHIFLKFIALRIETSDNSSENWRAYHRRCGVSGLARFRVKVEILVNYLANVSLPILNFPRWLCACLKRFLSSARKGRLITRSEGSTRISLTQGSAAEDWDVDSTSFDASPVPPDYANALLHRGSSGSARSN